MKGEPKRMTCEEFQSLLPELLSSGEDVQAHPHYVDCAHCRALLQDLEAIAAAARELLPVEEPSEALWSQIEKAIEVEEALEKSGRSVGAVHGLEAS